MQTGTRGTFVIRRTQTEVDGVSAAPRALLVTGASWRWTGAAVRVDGPQSLLLLAGDPAGAELRRHVARTARRLAHSVSGGALGAVSGAVRAERAGSHDLPRDDLPPLDHGVVLTDGRRSYEALLIPAAGDDPAGDLLAFVGALPPPDQELWVVRCTPPAAPKRAGGRAGPTGLICFTPGTRIATPRGPRLIETLAPGDRILTKDNGPQPVVWTGRRRLSGARLYAQPDLRPIRFRAGVFGIGRPDPDLLVSPSHRMLVQGAAARALFNAAEVLVAARDLVDGGRIRVDARLSEVTYVHILLERHQILWANGLETESFHPSGGALETIAPDQRAALFAACPDLTRDPQLYGGFARRDLTAPEAAILRHDAA